MHVKSKFTYFVEIQITVTFISKNPMSCVGYADYNSSLSSLPDGDNILTVFSEIGLQLLPGESDKMV